MADRTAGPTRPADAAALVALLDEYARSPSGGGEPLAATSLARLPALLASRPHYLGWLAWEATGGTGGQAVGEASGEAAGAPADSAAGTASAGAARKAVGLINCFEGVSTFRAQPLINVHDLIVTASHRRLGIGQALLAQVEHEARARGCCKLTLEVLTHNDAARRAYDKVGFAPYALDPAMGNALLLEKKFY